MNETGLVRYDAMCRAIAEAHRFDEAKEIRHKALALERYAAQAMNMEAERKALDIRLRAERRAGELLKEMKANGERATQSDHGKGIQASVEQPDTRPTLSDLGISRDQASQWQKLADVGEDEFEEALRDPEKKPSTSGIIRKHNGSSTQMNENALWLWGRLRDFEKRAITSENPSTLAGEMTDAMRADVVRIVPFMCSFIHTLMKSIDD